MEMIGVEYDRRWKERRQMEIDEEMKSLERREKIDVKKWLC